jgi:beta-galactosidase
MGINQIVNLYTKYVGDWGGNSTVYRFDAIKNGKVIKSVTKTPMTKMHLEIDIPSAVLCEKTSYDVGILKILARDENGNLLPYCNEALKISIDGPLEVIGSDIVALRGGMGGFYVKTVGKTGIAKITISCSQCENIELEITIK